MIGDAVLVDRPHGAVDRGRGLAPPTGAVPAGGARPPSSSERCAAHGAQREPAEQVAPRSARLARAPSNRRRALTVRARAAADRGRAGSSREVEERASAIWTPPMPSVSEWCSLHDQRRPAVGEPLDQGHLPQRAGVVELVHLRAAGHLQDVVEGARRGCRDPADVVAQVEVGVVHPPRRRRRQRARPPAAGTSASADAIRSKRSTSTSQSGERSSMKIVTTVERSRASCSIPSANASLLRMKSVHVVLPSFRLPR